MTYCLLGREVEAGFVLKDFGELTGPETPEMLGVVAAQRGWDLVFVFGSLVSLQEAQQWLQSGRALSEHPKATALIVCQEPK